MSIIRWMKRCCIVLYLVWFGLMSWFCWYMLDPMESQEIAVVVRIQEKEALSLLSNRLYVENLIEHPRVFHLALWGAGQLYGEIKEGEIVMRKGMSPKQVLKRLYRKLQERQMVTIPEGYTSVDIAELLERKGITTARGFLEACAKIRPHPQADSAQGYLFPDTYELWDGSSPQIVVEKMVKNYHRKTRGLLERYRSFVEKVKETRGLSFHQILILASIIEKEAVVDEERAMISGVYWNRIESKPFPKKGRLEADPTVQYGCIMMRERVKSCEGYDGTITRAMLLDKTNPYNTYQHGGLPPGPISNPGLKSIEAALHPASHRYMYFVAVTDGRHAFSETLEEHRQFSVKGRAKR